MKANQLNVVSYRDFIDPAEKDEDWILKAVQHHYVHGSAKNLLHGKSIKEIQDYAVGNHDMAKFRAMFPKKKRRKSNEATATDLDLRLAIDMGIDFKPLGILQQPLAQAISALQKAQVDINFDAIDATANADRQMDLDRVRNRPLFDEALAGVRNVLKLPIESPRPENNTPTVDMQTLGLNPQKEDELNLWADVFYKLRPESAFEVATDAVQYLTDFKMKHDLEKRDHVLYGVSCNRAYMSDVTGLPMLDYVFPGHVWAPDSMLPDYSDVPYMWIEKPHNVEQLLNVAGKEELPEELVANIFERYWKSIGYSRSWYKATETQKLAGVPVVYMEFKSFDVMRIEKFTNRAGRKYSNVVPFGYNGNSGRHAAYKMVENKWPQQTYFAYWVPGTDVILKSGKILGSVRAPGKESLSRFTIQVERSKEKSDVEQCMTAVDDAQRAYIKLQQMVIMSKPPGMYFDMKYIRDAAEQLQDDLDMSAENLLNLFLAHNIMIGDTENMNGDNASQFLPFRQIPGGMGGEIRELLEIIMNSNQFIARLTGYNDALTGQTPNADALVGMEKLRLQASFNALHPSLKATRHQVEKTVRAWAPMIQYICEPKNKGTAARKALENIIGSRKISLIDDMDKLSAHHFGLRVEDAPSVEQQEELRAMLVDLVRAQRVDLSDFFAIRRVLNYKDAQQLLVIKEKKKADDLRQQMKEANDAAVRAAQVRVEGDLQKYNMMAQGEVQEVALQNEGAMALFERKAQLELQLADMNGKIELMKKGMQGTQTQQKMFTKHNLDQQRPIT